MTGRGDDPPGAESGREDRPSRAEAGLPDDPQGVASGRRNPPPEAAAGGRDDSATERPGLSRDAPSRPPDNPEGTLSRPDLPRDAPPARPDDPGGTSSRPAGGDSFRPAEGSPPRPDLPPDAAPGRTGNTLDPRTAGSEDWLEANRANWDERVGIHLGAASYDLGPLRAGRGALHPIEERELGPVAGLRVLHLQCHFGRDSLTLAQRGASVTGVDFSEPAIRAARALASELGLPARFVLSDVHGAPEALGGERFDLVVSTWGAINWLPDIRRWARVVAACLAPGGRLHLAEGHPAAMVLDDEAAGPDGRPGRLVPYFLAGPYDTEDPADYADPEARLRNARTVEWMHPLGEVVTAVIEAGLRLDWLHEHPEIPWRMFSCLVEAPGGMHRWPDRPWLPLALSLSARRDRSADRSGGS